jgi:delta-1-pyrroline-5-carboxylate synthetase
MGAISLKDNDSLAAMLAAEVQADLLVLMSDVDGIYTKPPSQEGARLLCTYTPDMKDLVKFGKKSRVGTGGMDSKVHNLTPRPSVSVISENEEWRLLGCYAVWLL